MKMDKNTIALSINKVLLQHGHIHLFGCFHVIMAELSSCNRDIWPVKSKLFIV